MLGRFPKMYWNQPPKHTGPRDGRKADNSRIKQCVLRELMERSSKTQWMSPPERGQGLTESNLLLKMASVMSSARNDFAKHHEVGSYYPGFLEK